MTGPILERLTRLSAPRTGPARPLRSCPLCGSDRWRVLGIRGNREHAGADPRATPHLFTNVTRCGICDFIVANPPIPEAEALEAEHYGKAETYDAAGDDARASSMFRDRITLLSHHAARGRLLDVGAGKGEFLREARAAGYEVEGVEPSAGLSAFARSRGLAVHHGLLGAVDDIEPRSFDIVTLNHVLEHVPAPRPFLATVRGYLAERGVLFVEVPNTDAHLARVVDLAFRARGRDWSCRLSPVHPPFHSQGYTARSLRWVLEHEGFEVLEMVTRSGRDRGVGRSHALSSRAVIDVAFRAFSLLGNRELLLAIARPRAR